MKFLQHYLIAILIGSFGKDVSSQNVTVTNIEESRTLDAHYDFCRINIQPIGDEILNYSFYKVQQIISAMDSKGVNLVGETELEKEYKNMEESFSIILKKASRSATNISVDGILHLFKPTEANGGIIKLSGITKKPEINLAPKDAKFKVFYYDKQTMLKKNAVDVNERYDLIQKLPENEQEFANEINNLVSSVSYYSDEDLDRALFFVVNGDKSSLLGMTFEDAKGKKIAPYSSSISGGLYIYFFDYNIDPNMKVVLNVENQKAIKSIPFSVRNVILP
ncbi:MAG: hypothetical protein WAU01_15015 [Saprospiraceae bacterium]